LILLGYTLKYVRVEYSFLSQQNGSSHTHREMQPDIPLTETWYQNVGVGDEEWPEAETAEGAALVHFGFVEEYSWVSG
jgi:hypothetical protein